MFEEVCLDLTILDSKLKVDLVQSLLSVPFIIIDPDKKR